MRLALTVLAALLLGPFLGYQRGRLDGRRESAAGYAQAARNGYDEGLADGRAGVRRLRYADAR